MEGIRDKIGCQVIFCLEYEIEDVIIDEIKPRRMRKMAEKKGISTSPVLHLAHLRLCNKKDEAAETPVEYKFQAIEKDNLIAALALVEEKSEQWKQRSDQYGLLTAQWLDLEKQAKDTIGRVRSFWRMRFDEGNTYERTAGIDKTPKKKSHISQALQYIVQVSDDNAGSPAELPASLRDTAEDLFNQTRENLEGTEIHFHEKTDSYSDLKDAIVEKGVPALKACREHLHVVLPKGKHDEMLGEWGFEPWDYPTHQKPADQHIIEKDYDKTTDKIKIRLEEDILANEYIIEYGKTQTFGDKQPSKGATAEPVLPAPPVATPPNWTPAEWEVFATGDEPFFELGPLVEGNTYAFRGRAKNGAGYGGYSEIWIVEVV